MVSKAKAIKALEDVAQSLRTSVVALAPRKTGKLKDALYRWNTPQRILGAKKLPNTLIKTGKFNLKLSIDVSPPGAEYGKWWNDPTVSRTVKSGKTKNVPRSINFVSKAMKEAAIKRKIKELGPILASIVGQEIMEDFRKG
jgi:hypothetical protein